MEGYELERVGDGHASSLNSHTADGFYYCRCTGDVHTRILIISGGIWQDSSTYFVYITTTSSSHALVVTWGEPLRHGFLHMCTLLFTRTG